VLGNGSSGGGGGDKPFTGRAAIGYDGEIFSLGLALDERYVEGCQERMLMKRNGSLGTSGMTRLSGR
jgi:hypothetical protein